MRLNKQSCDTWIMVKDQTPPNFAQVIFWGPGIEGVTIGCRIELDHNVSWRSTDLNGDDRFYDEAVVTYWHCLSLPPPLAEGIEAAEMCLTQQEIDRCGEITSLCSGDNSYPVDKRETEEIARVERYFMGARAPK